MSAHTSNPSASRSSTDHSSHPDSTSAETHEAQRKQAEDTYHQTLVDLGVFWLTECAKTGWTPADLRHEFTCQIDPLLFHALSTVTCAVPDELLDYWFAETYPGNLRAISVSSLEKIVRRLPLLPPLKDWRLLDRIQLHDDDYLRLLSPTQRKAHDRILSLLKKAESTTFEKEAEALVEKAESLRQQYRIEDLLTGSYSGSSDSGTVVSHRIRLHAPWVNYQMRLLGTIAHANSCTTVLLTKSGIATVFGSTDDVEHVSDLFTSLNRQRGYFMQTSAGAKTAQEQNQTSSYRRSFMVAYASQVGVLLKRAAQNVMDNLENSAPSAPDAVILVLEKRLQCARGTMNSVFPNTRAMSISANNLLGFHDGREAASKSHFSGDSSGLFGQRQLTGGNAGGDFPTYH